MSFVNLLICVFNSHTHSFSGFTLLFNFMWVVCKLHCFTSKDEFHHLKFANIFKPQIFSWSVFMRCLVVILLLKIFSILRIIKLFIFFLEVLWVHFKITYSKQFKIDVLKTNVLFLTTHLNKIQYIWQAQLYHWQLLCLIKA